MSRFQGRGGAPLMAAMLLLAAACSAPAAATDAGSVSSHSPARDPTPTASSSSPVSPSPPTLAKRRAAGVYDAITAPRLSPAVAGIPTRVYVPDNDSNDVRVIDPRTFRVVRTISVGREPQHISPSWDLRYLYVGNVYSNSLTVIDPRRGRAVRTISVPDPYNLYFSPDGTHAIDVAEGRDTLYFYDPQSWRLRGSLVIPFRGPDHLDFSRGGHYFLISTEYAGVVVKIGMHPTRMLGSLALGGSTVDVKLSPNGKVFYVANQTRNGVSVVDPETMHEVRFIATGAGAHGFAIARDGRHLHVSNRIAGSISVIDTRTQHVVHTWPVGLSPDMLQVSPDGRQLWASNRFDASVSVISTVTGRVLHVIPVGLKPHGLTLFPQPGRYSLGHNGVYR